MVYTQHNRRVPYKYECVACAEACVVLRCCVCVHLMVCAMPTSLRTNNRITHTAYNSNTPESGKTCLRVRTRMCTTDGMHSRQYNTDNCALTERMCGNVACIHGDRECVVLVCVYALVRLTGAHRIVTKTNSNTDAYVMGLPRTCKHIDTSASVGRFVHVQAGDATLMYGCSATHKSARV